jgi:hypothetical protein
MVSFLRKDGAGSKEQANPPRIDKDFITKCIHFVKLIALADFIIRFTRHNNGNMHLEFHL